MLLGTLFTLAIFAAMSSFSLLSAYITFRLVAHLRAGGYAAVGGWTQEIRGTFIENKTKFIETETKNSSPPSVGPMKKEPSEESDLSVVSNSEAKHEGAPST